MVKTIIIALFLCVIEILVIVIAGPMAKSSLVLRFLPEDVKDAAKGHVDPPKSRQMVAHGLLALFLISMLAGIIYIGVDGIRNGIGYLQLALRFIVLLYVMKVFDIVVQDQWLVMTVGYFKKIFPETADCAGWNDRGFNNRNQIIRIILHPFLSMLTAGIFMLFR